jgi:acyl-CoA synthetase (AMP-forming)/AMP-acid ligase II
MLPELALLLSTSGSTGSPRLVRLSGKNLESNAQSISEYLRLSQDERPLTVLPMHYSYGLSVINSHLLVGASIALTDKSIMQRELWDFAANSNATSLSGVPYTYAMLKRLRFFRKDGIPSVHTLTQAGGGMDKALTAEVADFCEANGKQLFVMYGQTEATARMSYVPPARLREKLGSIGIPVPGGCLSLNGLANDAVGEENAAELTYEGPNVMLGYAESASDLAKPDVNKGVLLTGDVAWRDSDGFYFIVGRVRRFIKVFGNRIGLDEVERLLASEGIDIAATGCDDKLMLACEHDTDPGAIDEALGRLFGLNRAAYEVRQVDVVPRNEAGKIQYKSLLEMFVAQS